jgi:Protein phosphatase 2C
VNADSAFQIGSTHAVCQDYAVAGDCAAAVSRGEVTRASCGPYAILSDGCSSSPDTDTGARLLVKAAERLLREACGPPADCLAALHAEAARRALSWAELLGLAPQSVDATLLTAHLCGDELIVGCSGDGVVCLQTTDGALDVYSVSYPAGFPVYPAYAQQPARLRALVEAGRARKELTRLRADACEERLRVDECGERLRADSIEGRLRRSEVSEGGALTEVFAVRADEYEFASLFSDGIHSFFQTARADAASRNAQAAGRSADAAGRSEAVPFESVLPELVSFKNTRGAFVGRRMKGFMKDCGRRGWRHADDLAVAALHLGG